MLIVTTHDRLIEASVNKHNEITKLLTCTRSSRHSRI